MLNHLAIYPKSIAARVTCPSTLQCHPKYLQRLATARPRPILQRLPYSTGGYGDSDGKGDPEGKNPTAQGVNRRTREMEHPGPSPPDTRSAKSKSSEASKTSSNPTSGNKKNIPRSAKEELNNDKK
ncbi:hypothetical protein PENANT_c001G00265 [Penicillium antarcticum]|uniref:Uncharacterized protein n=1 Tax=Penicillium antarcticum TaxID=416450 RepID=A0A1V6QNM4_9EURO|nr:uncharacterized protein N7508_010067 [Penicillium antarcticum]KAJ5295246.1 hypothetical protein N7508_010067 [Penicillium antarcticum]OQD90761.1 hypothetical protein PENANT_c001G00265 [Penicillium antarcticum]